MIYKFKITIKQQLLMLNSLMIIVGIPLICYLYMFGFTKLHGLAIVAVVIVFSLMVLPVLILHSQYYKQNRKSEFIVDKRNREIFYHSPKINIESSFDNIRSLESYCSFAEKQAIYTFSDYRYFKIILLDGQEIIITSLMMYDIKNKMEELLSIKAERHFGFLALIKKRNYAMP